MGVVVLVGGCEMELEKGNRKWLTMRCFDLTSSGRMGEREGTIKATSTATSSPRELPKTISTTNLLTAEYMKPKWDGDGPNPTHARGRLAMRRCLMDVVGAVSEALGMSSHCQ